MELEKLIHTLRGQKIILDTDLAYLYGVSVKDLNRSVKRNLDRFPNDFMFQLTEEESTTFSRKRTGRGGKSYLPYAFTENGVAMLSSVLSSPFAIQVNISIMRFFTQARHYHKFPLESRKELDELKVYVNKLFEVIFERLDSIEETLEPPMHPQRKKIGLK